MELHYFLFEYTELKFYMGLLFSKWSPDYWTALTTTCNNQSDMLEIVSARQIAPLQGAGQSRRKRMHLLTDSETIIVRSVRVCFQWRSMINPWKPEIKRIFAQNNDIIETSKNKFLPRVHFQHWWDHRWKSRHGKSETTNEWLSWHLPWPYCKDILAQMLYNLLQPDCPGKALC